MRRGLGTHASRGVLNAPRAPTAVAGLIELDGTLEQRTSRTVTVVNYRYIYKHMRYDMLFCMQSTSVRIDRATHEELKALASELGSTVGETVALAVRRLRQDRIGAELKVPLTDDEFGWLDADLG